MPFDEDPQATRESYPCPCGGIVMKDDDKMFWECDSCDFRRLILTVKKGEYDRSKKT